MIQNLRKDVQALANPKKAKLVQGYFKTGPGQYGEGDIFLGLTVPQSRTIAVKYKDLAYLEISALLKSKNHEERFIALVILRQNYKYGNEKDRKKTYNFYLKHLRYINNWDLVDLSAHCILGAWLMDKDRKMLLKLATSQNLWSRRIAVVATYHFIKYEKSSDWTFKIAEMLLNDKHDLIHKAIGWMLREIGKNISHEEEEIFLKEHYKQMPRTMLRYAIEHFDPALRQAYMKNKIA
ncbi:MAG: DNA alkylation repair protein [Bacteroidetes bacterium]|nr:DNA alkylation repair protein [Bacteroidota bacterium]